MITPPWHPMPSPKPRPVQPLKPVTPRTILALTLALALALGGCGAVDTLGDRLKDAAGELRAAGGRFAQHLGAYLEAEGCTLIRRHAPWAPALFGICEDPR